MTEPKFTPGPWEWIGKNALWGGERATADILSASDDGQPYGMAQPIIEHHWNEETAEANRNLIAAAPELYKALERIDDFLRDDYMDAAVFSEIIYNAFAKARGESHD